MRDSSSNPMNTDTIELSSLTLAPTVRSENNLHAQGGFSPNNTPHIAAPRVRSK